MFNLLAIEILDRKQDGFDIAPLDLGATLAHPQQRRCRRERFREPVYGQRIQLDDKVDVASEAGRGVEARRKGSGDHVWNAQGVEPNGDELEDFQLVGNLFTNLLASASRSGTF
jgi:hypothetical protein